MTKGGAQKKFRPASPVSPFLFSSLPPFRALLARSASLVAPSMAATRFFFAHRYGQAGIPTDYRTDTMRKPQVEYREAEGFLPR